VLFFFIVRIVDDTIMVQKIRTSVVINIHNVLRGAKWLYVWDIVPIVVGR
jgi:hypothetical protein